MYSHGHDQIVVKLRQTPLCLYCGITVRLWCGVTVHLWTIKGRWTTVDTYPYSQIIILDYKYVIAKSSWSFKGSAVRIKGNKPKKKKRSKTKKEKKCTKFESTVFPWIIAGGNYFFFHIRRGRLFEGGDYFKYCSLEVKPLNILFYYPIELKKIITSNKLNMGFLSVPNLVPWLIFRAWLITDIVLLDQISFQLDREGIKERVKEREGGWGGGDYWREAIISNISIKVGQFFERGDYLRDGYDLRKYGMLSLGFKLTPSESSISEVGSLTNTPHNHWIIVMLKLFCLKHFSLPWMLFEVDGTEFIMNSMIN